MGNQGSAATACAAPWKLFMPAVIGQAHELHVWSTAHLAPGLGASRRQRIPSRRIGLGFVARPRARCGPFKEQRAFTYLSPSIGADGLTSAPAPWATWPATPCNIPFRGPQTRLPLRNRSRNGGPDQRLLSDSIQIRFQFPAREGLAPVTFRWSDGGKRTRGSSHDNSNKPPKEVTADILTIETRFPTAAV